MIQKSSANWLLLVCLEQCVVVLVNNPIVMGWDTKKMSSGAGIKNIILSEFSWCWIFQFLRSRQFCWQYFVIIMVCITHGKTNSSFITIPRPFFRPTFLPIQYSRLGSVKTPVLIWLVMIRNIILMLALKIETWAYRESDQGAWCSEVDWEP